MGAASENNTIRIGGGYGGAHTATYIQGISGVTISPAGAAVYCNSAGQLAKRRGEPSNPEKSQ